MKPITEENYVVKTNAKPARLEYHKGFSIESCLKFITQIECASGTIFESQTTSFKLNESDFRLILSTISAKHPEYHFIVIPDPDKKGSVKLFCNNFLVKELEYSFIVGTMDSLVIDGSITYKGVRED